MKTGNFKSPSHTSIRYGEYYLNILEYNNKFKREKPGKGPVRKEHPTAYIHHVLPTSTSGLAAA